MIGVNQLNPEQQEAVRCHEGPLLVLAGAGSGKTRVVTCRIADLIEGGVPPGQILGLTFTNKAAREMKERVERLTQRFVLVSTFHSLGARILRESIHHLGYRHGFAIYDDDDVNKVLKGTLADLQIPDKRGILKGMRHLISQAKNAMQLPSDIDVVKLEGEVEEAFPEVYARYREHLKQYNAVDFDDLLVLTVQLFEEQPEILEMYQDRWRYLMIDEYQDTNEAQYQIVKHLVAKTHNLCVVGDPDQSIYSWRGANISNILSFTRDYPEAKVVHLEQNYRSRTNILEGANHLIGHNNKRWDKNLWSDLGSGEKIKRVLVEHEQAEASFVARKIKEYQVQGIPLKEMVVFYRTNAQSRSFEDRLLSERIPYVLVGAVSFYQRREVKDILAFLRTALSDEDFVSFSRTINLPRRGIGGATIDKVRRGAEMTGQPLLAYCRDAIAGKTPLKLTKKQKEGFTDYLALIDELRTLADKGDIAELVKGAIKKSGYQKVLQEDRESMNDRQENLNQLVTKATEWQKQADQPTLEMFLEELSLRSGLDESQTDGDCISLMTLHNGKGLEFQVVYMAGLEEGLLPHVNSFGKPDAREEERRLCYVGMTRAKEYLYMLHAQRRYLWGTIRTQRPSHFLHEVPNEYVEDVRPSYLHRGNRQPIEVGVRVFHQVHGIGIVQECVNDRRCLVHFTRDDSEREILLANLLKLKTL